MRNLLVIAALGLIAAGANCVSADPPGQEPKSRPAAFQVVLTALFPDNFFSATSDAFSVGEGMTAEVECIFCASRWDDTAPANLAFRLYAGIAGGGSVMILERTMQDSVWAANTPIAAVEFASADFVSACIGKSCDSHGPDEYDSL